MWYTYHLVKWGMYTFLRAKSQIYSSLHISLHSLFWRPSVSGEAFMRPIKNRVTCTMLFKLIKNPRHQHLLHGRLPQIPRLYCDYRCLISIQLESFRQYLDFSKSTFDLFIAYSSCHFPRLQMLVHTSVTLKWHAWLLLWWAHLLLNYVKEYPNSKPDGPKNTRRAGLPANKNQLALPKRDPLKSLKLMQLGLNSLGGFYEPWLGNVCAGHSG